jgi:hypothetical protein
LKTKATSKIALTKPHKARSAFIPCTELNARDMVSNKIAAGMADFALLLNSDHALNLD